MAVVLRGAWDRIQASFPEFGGLDSLSAHLGLHVTVRSGQRLLGSSSVSTMRAEATALRLASSAPAAVSGVNHPLTSAHPVPRSRWHDERTDAVLTGGRRHAGKAARNRLVDSDPERELNGPCASPK
ncbi:hypothetical protein GCM10009789_12240 [Kribbella sancticallisti]|uniref:Uncharacterized protein n=1 Tax=Kribbella sancticallisti TaxID=460087 RepID=A0ABP4NHM7_9ACTN